MDTAARLFLAANHLLQILQRKLAGRREMKTNEQKFYHDDDPEIVATVMIDGRPIKLKNSEEFNAFIDSVILLDPEPMFQQAIWLVQMSHFLESGDRGDEYTMHALGKTIVPAATPEAHELIETLYDLGDAPRRAVAVLLRTIAKRFFDIATDRDPSLVPDE